MSTCITTLACAKFTEVRNKYQTTAAKLHKMECLNWAHEFESKVPMGQTGARNPISDARWFRGSNAPAVKSLPVLRYVCEQMDSAFAREVLCGTARSLADHTRSSKSPHEELEWQMVLNLEHTWGARSPFPSAPSPPAGGS
jgi:hypothetical protein